MGRTGRNSRQIQRQSDWKTKSYFARDREPNGGKTFREGWRSIYSQWNTTATATCEKEHWNNCGMFKFTN